MFPLNLNTILIGILIAIAILAYIYILKEINPEKILENFSPKKSPNTQRQEKKEEKQKPKKEEPEKKPETKRKKNETKKNETKKKDGKPRQSESSSPRCAHEFGYLGTLPKNASIPDECLGCTKIIECLAEK